MTTLAHAAVNAATTTNSPLRRAWRRFRTNRLGYGSLILFLVIFVVSLCAEVLSNDKPLVVRYNGQWFFPVIQTLPETTFGGDFPTPTDYLDPQIRKNITTAGNFALYPPNRPARTARRLARRDQHRPIATSARLGDEAPRREDWSRSRNQDQ